MAVFALLIIAAPLLLASSVCPVPPLFPRSPESHFCSPSSPKFCPERPALDQRCFPESAPLPDPRKTRMSCGVLAGPTSKLSVGYFQRWLSCLIPGRANAPNTSPEAVSPAAAVAAAAVGGEGVFGSQGGGGGRWFTRGRSYEGFMWKLLVDYASVSSGGKLVGSTAGISNAGDILVGDESRYALSPCDLENKKFIIKLAETIYVDKIGLVSSEFYAATYRHIQVLGSFKWPTSEWRLLGEIETNPLATAEVFDLSETSQCPKCFVRFIKLRVLSHHTIEGFSRCALTRVQVFGSTLLESIDRLSATNGETNATNVAVQSLRSAVETVDRRLHGDFSDVNSNVGRPLANNSHTHTHPHTPGPGPIAPGPGGDAADSPLLKFIEDMTELQRNYAKVSASVSTLVTALQAAQSEISSLQISAHNVNITGHSNISGLSDVSGRPGLLLSGGRSDGWAGIFEPQYLLIFCATLAISQIFLFVKLSASEHLKASSSGLAPSRLDSSPRSSILLRPGGLRMLKVKRKSVLRAAQDKHRSLFKGSAAFKAARHVSAPRPRASSLS